MYFVSHQKSIPLHIVEQVLPWEPVQTSVTLLKRNRYSWSRGDWEDQIFSDIVYFWDALDREIGFWWIRSEHVHVLAPNFRVWHPEIFAANVFSPLERVG